MRDRVVKALRGWAPKFVYQTYSAPAIQVKKLVSFAKKLRNQRSKVYEILDVGAGECRYERFLEELGEVITMDLKPYECIKIAGDCYRLPFRDQSFDVVCLFSVLEHLHSPWLALKECNRILRVGGVILIIAPQYWHTHCFPCDYYRFTRYALEHLCKDAGFIVLNCWSTGGPFLVLFHVLELNLRLLSFSPKTLLYNFLGFILDKLDKIFFNHQDSRQFPDSVGWAVLAQRLNN
jgi:SAM-dependent methyltransferase